MEPFYQSREEGESVFMTERGNNLPWLSVIRTSPGRGNLQVGEDFYGRGDVSGGMVSIRARTRSRFHDVGYRQKKITTGRKGESLQQGSPVDEDPIKGRKGSGIGRGTKIGVGGSIKSFLPAHQEGGGSRRGGKLTLSSEKKEKVRRWGETPFS